MNILAIGLFALMSSTSLAAAASSPADAANTVTTYVATAAQSHGTLSQSGISSNAARAKGKTKSGIMTVVFNAANKIAVRNVAFPAG